MLTSSDTPSLLIADHMPVRLTVMLWNPLEYCYSCGADPVVRYELPINQHGVVVERDYPGLWFSAPCCLACYRAYAKAGIVGLDIRQRTLLEMQPAAPDAPQANVIIDLDMLHRRVPIIGDAQ